jgi:hypothetical protein
MNERYSFEIPYSQLTGARFELNMVNDILIYLSNGQKYEFGSSAPPAITKGFSEEIINKIVSNL